MATQVALTPEHRAGLAQGAQELVTFMMGDAARKIASRVAFWSSLQASARAIGVESQARQLFPDLWSRNEKADADARAYAELLAGLRSGRYQIAAWTTNPEVSIVYGVMRAGASAGELGIPFVPILWFLGSAAVAGGAWVVTNAFATAQQAASEAELLRAQTAQQITQATTALSQRDPQAAAQLANALAEANKAALGATPGLLDRLVGGVQRAVSTAAGAVGGGGGALLLLGLLWLLSRRGRA